jgi:hypothetical protein
MKKTFIFIVVLCLLCATAYQYASANILFLCPNSAGSCGMTESTYWFKFDETDCYTVDNEIPGTSYLLVVLIVAIPLYRMCIVCGYSCYEIHIEIPIVLGIK